jgi:hypothetical protein
MIHSGALFVARTASGLSSRDRPLHVGEPQGSPSSPRTPSSFLYARPMPIPRRLERFILGTMMSLVALVAERRVVKALGKKRR